MTHDITIGNWTGYLQETVVGPFLFLQCGKIALHFVLNQRTLDLLENQRVLNLSDIFIQVPENEVNQIMAFASMLLLK